MKRESLNTSIQSPHFQSRSGMMNHAGMMDYPRISYYGMESRTIS